jgi:ubiquinone/menaquinone biosynthesis C-methylase UbiE
MPLDSQAARRFYDRLGRLQATQAFYESAALARLTQLARLEDAHSLFELGCGTGRYAAGLMTHTLPADADYLGVDLSPRMVELTRTRLEPWQARAKVRRVDPPALSLPGADGGFDRFLSTYVLDLLAPEDGHALLWR